MPIVPGATGPMRQQLPQVDSTYLMMAAAELHEAGRLIDRREQTSKERDNAMVDDQQLPPVDGGMDKDVFGKLSKEVGTGELDRMERDNIVAAVTRGMKR